MKKAILSCRVSSDEQSKGYSLDIQQQKLLDYCKKEGIQVVGIYREDHSAKNFNRPEFKKMLDYLRKNKGKVDLLLVTSWDRFSRNVNQSFAMLDRLMGYGVEVNAMEQPLDLSIPENLLLLSVYLTIPDIDNRRRSMKITEGVRAAKASGRYSGLAPYGYINTRDDQGKPLIAPGPKATMVQEIFRKVAAGKSQSELRIELARKGHPFSKSTLSDLLRKRVYLGEVAVKDKDGRLYYVRGLHEPLIEEELFYRVQDIMSGNSGRMDRTKAKSFKDGLALRGLFYCGACGKKMTGSTSRSRNGDRHDYYHCNHCGQVRLKAEAVHEKVEAILGELQIRGEAKKLYGLMVKKLLQEGASKKRPEGKIRADMEVYERRLTKMEDDYADGNMDADTFSRARSRYRGELLKLEAELRQSASTESEYTRYLKSGIDLLERLPQVYQSSSLTVKRELFGSIFSEKVYFDKKTCRTTRINEAVALILATSKALGHKKTGQPFKNLELSGQVEATGIEPVSKHDIQKLSTCLFRN